jgi:hypothetical protein
MTYHSRPHSLQFTPPRSNLEPRAFLLERSDITFCQITEDQGGRALSLVSIGMWWNQSCDVVARHDGASFATGSLAPFKSTLRRPCGHGDDV